MPRRLLVLAVSAVLLALAGAVPAAAAPRKVGVSGRVVGGGGMTVLALAPDGSARSVRLGPSGRFTHWLPRSSARGTTLQLVRTSGRYAGPVVLAARGGRSYTLLGGTAVKLGDISLRSGYARVVRTRLPKGSVLTTRWARGGSGGKPAGAGDWDWSSSRTTAPRRSAAPARTARPRSWRPGPASPTRTATASPTPSTPTTTATSPLTAATRPPAAAPGCSPACTPTSARP